MSPTVHRSTARRLAARCPLLLLAASILLATGAAAKTSPKTPPPAEGVVNINEATPQQLELLPGIGPAKAQRIVSYRAKRKFGATHELMRVRGIGRVTFRKLQRHLTVKGATTLTRRPPAGA